mmetsp:Transcript_37953/g.109519  ORF Transcript_37953/g.109519 Transcript_37953/m.109519 type:complete len:86 (+) Transcript_37953:144-401(+)
MRGVTKYSNSTEEFKINSVPQPSALSADWLPEDCVTQRSAHACCTKAVTTNYAPPSCEDGIVESRATCWPAAMLKSYPRPCRGLC